MSLLLDPSVASGQAAEPPAPRVLAAIVIPPHLAVSGGARAAERLSATLAPFCDVTVASMLPEEVEPARGQPPHRLPVRCWLPPLLPWGRLPRHFRTLFYRSDLPRLVAAGRYDLVHLHNPMPALEMERTARACRAAGLPYVVSTHGFNEIMNGERINGFGPLRRQVWRRLVVAPVMRTVRRAAMVFALSPADVPLVRAMGFAGPVRIVANGVPIPAPADPAADGAALQALGIPAARRPGQITAMFLANHTPNKGVVDLLEGFAALSCPYLLLLGGDTRPGIPYERYIRACRPGQRIVVTGRVPEAAVAAMFRRADLFVFPSRADTFPLVVLEAMAHGLPVLASRVGGIPHQLDAQSGLLIPPGDPGRLTAAVAALAQQPERLAAMGSHARLRVLTHFTWQRAAEQALAGYAEVLARPRPRQPGEAVG